MIGRPYIQLFLIVAMLIAVESSTLAFSKGAVIVSATVLSKNKCHFKTTPAPLSFGNLDPTNPVPVSADTSLSFRCGGSDALATVSFSGNGLHFSGGKRRLQNSSDLAVYIPYDLTFTPETAPVPRNVDQRLDIHGTIAGADYQYATAGTSYADKVTLSINP